MLRGSVWRCAAFGAVCCVLSVACGGGQDDGAAGSDCYRDADCKAGLVCVANTTGARVCSSDTTPLVSQVEGPPAPPPEEMPTEPVPEEPAPEEPDGGAPDGG